MHVEKVSIKGFRNLEDQDVELVRGLNLLVGENGQGKTNFLEAIYLLATLRSFRSASVRDVVCFGEGRAEVSGTVVSDAVPLELRVVMDMGGRRLWVGKRPVHAVGEFLGQLRVVAFTPDDLAMVKGGPLLRRRFMDRAGFLFEPRHLGNIKRFNSALKSRNRLLKDGSDAQREVIDSFSLAMSEPGSEVSRLRREMIECIGSRAENVVRELLQGSTDVSVSFKPGWEMGRSGSRDRLLRELRTGLEQDLRRGQTCLGPQQDDFLVNMGGGSARRFASQGQQRTVAVALILAVVLEVADGGGERPVILLDDVSSELDAYRRGLLFDSIEQLGGQVLITTTDERLVGDLEGRVDRRFSVSGGRIEREEEG